MTHPLAQWHAYTDAPSPTGLNAQLHENVVFHSPVVHTPQRGKQITFAYLWAANETLGNESFEYLREIGFTHMRIADGVNTLLQLLGLVGRLSRIASAGKQ